MTSPSLSCARRSGVDQLIGDLADSLLEPGLARLPGAAAEPVELDAGYIGAVARQELDVLDRQEQPVAGRIQEEQAVMRGVLDQNCLEPLEATDAMIDMDDEIAAETLESSEMKSPARRDLRARRTSRSPRMSCSAMIARSGVSKPCSRPSTTVLTTSPAGFELRPSSRRGDRRYAVVLQDRLEAARPHLPSRPRSPPACPSCAGRRHERAPRRRRWLPAWRARPRSCGLPGRRPWNAPVCRRSVAARTARPAGRAGQASRPFHSSNVR